MRPSRPAAPLCALLLAAAAPAADPPKEAPLPAGARARLGTTPFPSLFAPDFTLAPPDYKALAFAGTNSELVRLAVDTGAPQGERAVVAGRALVSTDGKRYVLIRAGNPVVRDAATGKVIRELDGLDRINPGGPLELTVALSADGKVFALGYQNRESKGEVAVWDVDRNEVLFRASVVQTAVPIPVLSADGKLLATRGSDIGPLPPGAPADHPNRVVQVWDVAAEKELFRAKPSTADGKQLRAVALSPDGSLLAASTGDGVADWWDVRTGKPRPPLRGRPGLGSRLAFSPDGKTLAAFAGGAVQRWVTADGKLIGTTDAPDRLSALAVQGVTFADDDRVLVWGTVGAAPTVWEAPARRRLTPLPEHTGLIHSVGFTADGKEVVTSGSDGRVVRWDAATGRPLGPVPLKWDRPWPRPLVAVAPGATRGVSEFNPAVYDLKTGAEEFALTPGVATVLVPDPTRAVVAFAAADPRKPAVATVWDLTTRKKLGGAEFESEGGGRPVVAISPSGARLVTASYRYSGNPPALVVTGWDVKTGKKLGEVEDATAGDPSTLPGEPDSVAAADDSSAVVSTKWGRVRAYDYAAGEGGRVFAGKAEWDGPASCLVAFAPDGKTLATGSTDTTVLLWDVAAVGK